MISFVCVSPAGLGPPITRAEFNTLGDGLLGAFDRQAADEAGETQEPPRLGIRVVVCQGQQKVGATLRVSRHFSERVYIAFDEPFSFKGSHRPLFAIFALLFPLHLKDTVSPHAARTPTLTLTQDGKT
jgi:hypothetical protein